MMNIGFIDYFLDEWHANNYPAWIYEASRGEMKVSHAFALIDSPREGGRSTDAWCRAMGVQRCDTMEQLVACCDALIVLSPDNTEMHEQLCQLALKSGKPTYVDKTFAPDLASARRIFALADEFRTPCWSSSALRFAAEYRGLGEDIQAISSWGPGGFDTYSVHQLEPIIMLMKSPARRVMYLAGQAWMSLAIEFADGRKSVLSCFEAGGPFSMNLCMPGGNRVVTVESDFFGAFISALVAFFRTRQPMAPREDTLNIMAARGAGILARARPGEWVEV